MDKPTWVKAMGWISLCVFAIGVVIGLVVSFQVGSDMRERAEAARSAPAVATRTHKGSKRQAAAPVTIATESLDNVTMIRQAAGILAIFVLVCVPAGMLWLIGTLLHRSRVYRARIQAGAFSEILARGSNPVVVVTSPAPAPVASKARTGPLGL